MILAIGGLALLLLIRPAKGEGEGGRPQHALATVTIAVLAAAFLVAARLWSGHPGGMRESFFGAAFQVDTFALFFTGLVVACAVFTVVASQPYAAQEGYNHAELYALLLFATAGMVLLASGTDLVVLFLGVETMSLAVYALVGIRRRDRKANEATMKYVLLGAFSSAILLYGIAMIYGATGTTNLMQIAAVREAGPGVSQGLYVAGGFLLLAGLGFKVASVPFHMWVPDVYEGAAAPITGFMATAVKAASFALVLRILLVGLGESHDDLSMPLWWLSALSMLAGNILALAQRNLKRMLAYSSIAHTGYMFIGLVTATRAATDGAVAILVYLAAYALTNLGAFACLAYFAGQDDKRVNLEDWAGAARRHPWIAVAMGVCMLSLIGFPPTAGFLGKYLLFRSAFEAGEFGLAVLGIANSILSVWYYLRVVVVMTMQDPAVADARPLPEPRWGAAVGAVYAAIAVLWAGLGTITLAGLLPGAQTLIGWARLSVLTLF
jgi:NADH-quinone oxidoreductase subunit N